jgi:rhodanese-related sulfurtransferase
MKKFAFLCVLFLFAAMSVWAQCPDTGACSGCPTADTCGVEMVDENAASETAPVAAVSLAPVKKLTVDEFAKMVEENKALLIVDARGEKAAAAGRIPGAIALTDAATPEEVKKILPQTDAAIVTYCTNLKCQASPNLAAKLATLGYTNVMELPDGIDGWEKAGKPVEKATK